MKPESSSRKAPSPSAFSPLLPPETFQPAFRRTALASAVVGGAMALGSAAQAQDSTSTAQGEVTKLAPVQSAVYRPRPRPHSQSPSTASMPRNSKTSHVS